jgi:hypothetical protein
MDDFPLLSKFSVVRHWRQTQHFTDADPLVGALVCSVVSSDPFQAAECCWGKREVSVKPYPNEWSANPLKTCARSKQVESLHVHPSQSIRFYISKLKGGVLNKIAASSAQEDQSARAIQRG